MDIEKVIKNFEKNGFSAVYFDSGNAACDYLCSRIQNTSVGIGGSMTVKQLNLFEKLSANNQVFWHWTEPGQETLNAAAQADVYIASANGVSETGVLVNIDGSGNRVSSTLFGHGSVYFVCGINKLEPDEESAVRRARNVASPLNARRLGVKTPCASGELQCHDCSSPERICKGLLSLWKKPNAIPHMEVVFIGETLGY